MSQNSARCECCNYDYKKEKLGLWPRQQHSTPLTFTATYFPLNLCLATCTCARLATPMGLGSNSSNNSSILKPMSSWKSFWTSSYAVGSHWSCKGLIALVHSLGSTMSEDMCCPSFMKIPGNDELVRVWRGERNHIPPLVRSALKTRFALRLWQSDTASERWFSFS